MDLPDVLVQARGLGIGLVLAHQHLGQLDPGVRSAVLANAGSRMAFRLDHDDAQAEFSISFPCPPCLWQSMHLFAAVRNTALPFSGSPLSEVIAFGLGGILYATLARRIVPLFGEAGVARAPEVAALSLSHADL